LTLIRRDTSLVGETDRNRLEAIPFWHW
jgi:hypothetical protein